MDKDHRLAFGIAALFEIDFVLVGHFQVTGAERLNRRIERAFLFGAGHFCSSRYCLLRRSLGRNEVEFVEDHRVERLGAIGGHVRNDAAIGHADFVIETQKVLNRKFFLEQAPALHHNLVGKDGDAFAGEARANFFANGAQAEDNIHPGFTTRRLAVELAFLLEAFCLSWKVLSDAVLGEIVENAEALFAQTFVDDEDDFAGVETGSLDAIVASFHRTQEGRAEDYFGTFVFRQTAEPDAQVESLSVSDVRERHEMVADVDVELVGF